MASIEKRTNGWDVRYRDPERGQRREHFTRKVDATRRKAEVEASLNRGEYVDHRDRTTVLEAARAWAEGRPVRPSTRQHYAQVVENHLAPTRLGGRRVGDVRPSEVQGWVADRATVLAPSTLRQAYKVLTAVFAAAVRDRRLVRTPCVGITLPRSETPRLVPLRVDEVRALSAAMPPRLGALVVVQAGCGLRLGEALGLRQQDVDFLRRTLRVDGQLSQRERVRTDTKTPRSRRTVPLPSPVAEALSAHLATYGAGQDGTVFTTQRGGYHHQEYVTRSMKAAVGRLGLPGRTTPHHLRHHYASVLLAQGESVITVAERIGDTPQTVMDTYGHLVHGHEERTRRAIEEAWSAQSVPIGQALGL